MSLPKFDFSKSTIKTTEALNTELKNAGEGESKFFRPGSYELEIVKVEHQGPAGDPNWHKFLLHFEGAGGKEIRYQLFVPVADVVYKGKSGKPTFFMFQKFTKAMEAVGVQVTVETLQDTLIKYFTNPDKVLKGLRVQAEIGYDGNYLRYEGKDDAGNKKYVIALDSGATVNGDDGQPLVFPDWQSAEGYATQKSIEIEKFTNVLSLARSASKPKVVNGW